MEQVKYPANHLLGMRVPHGGSNCAKCEYVSEDGRECAQPVFIKWNHGSKILPAPAEDYCCDMFEAAEGTMKRMASAFKKG
jgi:hypothetical protein